MLPRRTLIALAIGLAVGALAALAVEQRHGGSRRGGAGVAAEAPRPASRPVSLELRPGRRPAPRLAARVGDHVVLRVEVPAPGEVDLAALGLTASATPEAPATFDLLPDRAGSYGAVFRPAEGRPHRVGVLVVRPR